MEIKEKEGDFFSINTETSFSFKMVIKINNCCKICVYIVVKYVYRSITSKSIGFRVIVINYKIQTQAFLFKN